ncbi:unnamed protein product [Symbiodinium sp. CCMP2592]|nr:unnamed protein product [Symbiodinium sp. CCMP2592]
MKMAPHVLLLFSLCSVSAVQLENLEKLERPGNKTSVADGLAGMEDLLVSAFRTNSDPSVETLVTKMSEMIQKMKPPLLQNVQNIQDSLDTSAANVAKCSQNEHTTKSQDLKNDFNSKSQLHSQCRSSEKTKLDEKTACAADIKTLTESKDTTCGALAALEKSIYSYGASISVQNGETFKPFHSRLIQASQQKLAEWETADAQCTDATTKLTARTTECANADTDYTSQKAHCDSVQDAMDGFSCSYLEAQSSKCETMDTCFEQQTSNHQNILSTGQTQLESMRKEWRGFLRMECLIKAFFVAEADRPAAIDKCQAIDTKAQASADLKLVEPTLATKPSCPVPTDAAGTAGYRSAQYDSLPAEAPAKECVASCCGSGSTEVVVEYLIVAGGGGGGSGGGGAGGVIMGTQTLDTSKVVTVVVGDGGISGAGGYGAATGVATAGGDSQLGDLIAKGGGQGAGGSQIEQPGASGGSGGGGGFDRLNVARSSGVAGQGHGGGRSNLPGYGAGGGGGGAGAAGQDAPKKHYGGKGGDGVSSDITGTLKWYGGGGGGGVNENGNHKVDGAGGAGGKGGGGRGSDFGSVSWANWHKFTGTDGEANTGGGGGGTDPESRVAGKGGSGIVVVRYKSATPVMTGGTITSFGGYQIHTFSAVGASTLKYQ